MTNDSATRPAQIFALLAALPLLWLVPAAQAKTVANDPIPAPSSNTVEDAALYAGPIGATLESDYFRGPHVQSGNNKSLCRLHLYFSSQPFRLARSCE
jgi:hypothetical protein